jgi:hypothetical protein
MFEAAAMREGLQDSGAAERFFVALLENLEDRGPSQASFERLADAVERLPSERGRSDPNKWTVATILPFLARPNAFPFLKPQATQDVTRLVGFELMYDPAPNWRTYRRLLEFGEVLRQFLSDRGLEPRDWIDLQSFMWLVRGDRT